MCSDGQILHIIGNQLSPVPMHTVGKREYGYIHLQRDGKLYHRAADRLVLTAYVGKHDTYRFVRHADGNINNNAIDNLSWAPHKKCQICPVYGECCREYNGCKILSDEKAERKAKKPLSPTKQKLYARMASIAEKAKALNDADIKPSLIDIIAELRKGNLPNEVHAAMRWKGRTFTVQYVHKVMRMIESDDPRLYCRR